MQPLQHTFCIHNQLRVPAAPPIHLTVTTHLPPHRQVHAHLHRLLAPPAERHPGQDPEGGVAGARPAAEPGPAGHVSGVSRVGPRDGAVWQAATCLLASSELPGGLCSMQAFKLSCSAASGCNHASSGNHAWPCTPRPPFLLPHFYADTPHPSLSLARSAGGWELLDYSDVVLHIMTAEQVCRAANSCGAASSQ